MTPQSLQRGLGWATGAAGGGGIGIGVGALDAMGPAMGGAGMAGGKANPKTANWLMRWRIIFQFIAVALFAILLLLLKA